MSPTGLELYIAAFDCDVSGVAALLPVDLSDNFGSYDACFDTFLSASLLDDALSFTRSGDDLTINSSAPASWTDASFSIPHALYNSGTVFLSRTVPQELAEDYLGYVANNELGSEFLVGAFDNVPQIIAPIQNSVVTDAADAALTGHSYDIPQFITADPDIVPDNTALWVVYSEIIRNFSDRLTGAPDSEATPLLQAGDILVVKMVVHTPDVDASIAANGPAGYTPVHPADRTYKIRITLQ